MAERIPREESLRRVHGSGALFAAAYGNVGSSIYYALGVVALYALGLTPVTFMIAGLIFVFTAATYTEATVMYPEAGGSSSFARHAFNEMVSFIAAWGQMLNYTITVVVLLGALNIFGVREAAGLNIFLALVDFFTQLMLVVVGVTLVFSPETLIDNVDFGTSPTVSDFLVAIPVGMVAYTGIETISNMAEEARDYG